MAKTYEDTPTGQIRVETGRGRIAGVNLQEGRRNGQVTIRAEHLREDVKAWADSHNGDLWQTIARAHQSGEPITYRIEVKRKANADRAMPIDSLGNREKARDLAQVLLDGQQQPARQQPQQQQAPPPQQAQQQQSDEPTSPKDPRVLRILAHAGPIAVDFPPHSEINPKARQSIAAQFERARREGVEAIALMLDMLDHHGVQLRPQQPSSPPASDLPARSLEQARDPDGIAQPPQPTRPQAQQGPPPPDDGRGEQPPQRELRPGVRLQEGKAWEFYNSDGTINLGSYAMTAVVSVVNKATRLLLDRNVERHQAGEVAAVEHPERAEVVDLSQLLLWVCDRVQADVRSDHRVDRGANSHTRCRGAVFSAIERHPVPWHELDDPQQRDHWARQLHAYAVALLEVAIELLKG